MSPLVKKVIGALAIKEGLERIQEIRQPKRSMASRLGRPVLLLLGAGGMAYLYRSGKLKPLLQQAKGLTGSSENPLSNDAPSNNGSNSGYVSSSAPTA